jgi:hypothetical protein
MTAYPHALEQGAPQPPDQREALCLKDLSAVTAAEDLRIGQDRYGGRGSRPACFHDRRLEFAV